MAGLTREQVEALLGLSTAPEEEALLEHQLRQAEALRGGRSEPHTTGAGAALGGVGDVLRSLGGAFGERRATEGLRALLPRQLEGRRAFLGAMPGPELPPGHWGAADGGQEFETSPEPLSPQPRRGR